MFWFIEFIRNFLYTCRLLAGLQVVAIAVEWLVTDVAGTQLLCSLWCIIIIIIIIITLVVFKDH